MSYSLPLSSPPNAQASTYALPSGVSVTIHAAHLGDVNSLARLLADSFHPPNSWLFWLYPFLRLGIYEDLRTRLRQRRPQYECLAAMQTLQSQVIGTVEVAVRPVHDGQCSLPYPYISNLAVHPQHRRQGIAKRLLLNCEPQAIAWGFQDLYLHVLEDNQRARRLYEQLGYQWVTTEFTYANWLLQQPRRVLLHKKLRP